MIDLMWNFPLLREQEPLWRTHLEAAVREHAAEPVEAQRPSFRTVERELRERAARWLGFPVERTWIVAGGHHGTLNSLLASGLAGARVAVEAVSYPGFLDQCRLTRTEIVAVAIDDQGLVPSSLQEACERAQAEGPPLRGLFTMPTVQNPLGFVTPLARRQEIVAIARDFDLTIIEDDAYGYMQPDPPPSYAELAPERTFYIRGLAKSFAPGTRTGFLIAPETAADALMTSLRCTATGIDVLQNMAALALCEDGSLDRVIAAKREEGARRNGEARAILGDRCVPGCTNAWHLWVRLPNGTDPGSVTKRLLEQDVLASSGAFCAVDPELRFGLRLALGGEVEREKMLKGVRIVNAVLNSER